MEEPEKRTGFAMLRPLVGAMRTGTSIATGSANARCDPS